MTSPSGELLHPSGDFYGPGMDRTPFDYFICMFLQAHLRKMVRLSSYGLHRLGKPRTSVGAMLRFCGVLGNRRDLWSTTPASKHLDAAWFGRKTGMP